MKNKRLSKVMAWALTFALALTLAPVFTPAVYAAENTDWYTSQDASVTNFTISTADELAGLAKLVNEGTDSFANKTIRLTANINLSDYSTGAGWVPIGSTEVRSFRGTFEGNGRVITNLIIDSNIQYGGLFGVLGSTAIVREVGVESGSITITRNESSEAAAGGISGNMLRDATSGAIIEFCYNKAPITVINTGTANAGGISGILLRDSSIRFCFNTGDISATSSTTSAAAGGIVGLVDASGGLLNPFPLLIDQCYNTGNVSIEGTGIGTGTNTPVGGIFGFQIGSGPSSSEILIQNSYWNMDRTQTVNNAAMDPKQHGGAIIGDVSTITPLTSAQMRSVSGMSRFDFINIWGFLAGVNSGYPVLRVFHPGANFDGGGGSGGGSGSGRTAAASFRTVDFESNGGSAVPSQTVRYNTTVDRPSPPPVKAGFAFAGWYEDEALTMLYDFNALVWADMTLYARWAGAFDDVRRGDWFYEAVMWACENGYMTGTGPTSFSPNATLTRGMVVQVLWNLENNSQFTMHNSQLENGDGEGDESNSQLTTPPIFTDVADGAWYADAVKWAAANGIVTGVAPNRFAPDAPVTREQLATILYRYAVFSGNGPEGDWAVSLNFADAAAIAGYAVEGAMFCTMKGIITGKPGNLFDPKGQATRAEFATMLMRYDAAN